MRVNRAESSPRWERTRYLVRVCFGVGFGAGYETIHYYYYRLAWALLHGMVRSSASGRDDIKTGYGEKLRSSKLGQVIYSRQGKTVV